MNSDNIKKVSMFDKPLTECSELELIGRYISATGRSDDMEQTAIEAELESRIKDNQVDNKND